jgi:glycosyltransferase involved in cell wall biosynthesis
MESSVLNNADFAIMGNRESVSVWQGKGYKGPYEIIPQFGVSINRFKRQEQRTRGREFVIGTAGRRLVREKGIGLIIKSVAGLSGAWQLRIAGEGPERHALEQLSADFGLGHQVYFDGLISSEDMPAYLNQLDALVLASRTMPNWKEQFGRVLIEAMACEVPVIGSDSGEIPNVIGPAGLIFPEDDAEALRKLIQSLMDDEKGRIELSKSGLQRVLANFTQGKVADKTVSVYRKIMAQDE